MGHVPAAFLASHITFCHSCGTSHSIHMLARGWRRPWANLLFLNLWADDISFELYAVFLLDIGVYIASTSPCSWKDESILFTTRTTFFSRISLDY